MWPQVCFDQRHAGTTAYTALGRLLYPCLYTNIGVYNIGTSFYCTDVTLHPVLASPCQDDLVQRAVSAGWEIRKKHLLRNPQQYILDGAEIWQRGKLLVANRPVVAVEQRQDLTLLLCHKKAHPHAASSSVALHRALPCSKHRPT